MAPETKEILCESVQCQKFLNLSRGGKPTHVTFPLASRFVRNFGSVVRINLVDVTHGWHDRTMSGVIVSKFRCANFVLKHSRKDQNRSYRVDEIEIS